MSAVGGVALLNSKLSFVLHLDGLNKLAFVICLSHLVILVMSNSRKRETRIQWDEETIAEHDKERGTRYGHLSVNDTLLLRTLSNSPQLHAVSISPQPVYVMCCFHLDFTICRQKIDEAPTPYRYDSRSADESEKGSNTGSPEHGKDEMGYYRHTAHDSDHHPSFSNTLKNGIPGIQNPPPTDSGSSISDNWESINARLEYERHLQMQVLVLLCYCCTNRNYNILNHV